MLRLFLVFAGFLLLPQLAMAEVYEEDFTNLGLTGTERGIYTVLVFVIAYGFVMAEEFTGMRKSKPVIFSAAVIWAHAAILAADAGVSVEQLHESFEYNLAEFAALMLFLLVAMTYINAMAERNVFEVLRSWMIRKKFNYKQLFWVTGIITFFLSAVADNLTSALLVGAVVMAVGKGNDKFVAIGLVNLVVAANAGGAFSPFGDITTLMVWQAGYAEFFDFFALFIPSVVNYVIPAFFMYMALPDDQPKISDDEVGEFIDGIAEKTIEVLGTFEIDPGDMKPYSQILEEANTELGKLNLSYEQLVMELKQEKNKVEILARDLKEVNGKLRGMAFEDGLTALFNHRYFQDHLEREINRVDRYSHLLSLIMM